MMFSFIINFFERLEAWFKRAERIRIQRLEADLAHAKFALSYYSHPDSYPTFLVAGQQSSVLAERGERARQTLRLLGRPFVVEMPSAKARAQESHGTWAVYRDGEGDPRPERRAVPPV